jgi:hypothetical protein
MCKTCVGNDPAVAAANFHQRITELGGIVIGKYTNANTPVECLCPEGHQCTPQPRSIQQGNGMCKTCAGNDPAVAAANFHQRITELGGIVIGKYTNKNTPVECLCPEGHPCTPWPSSIQQGQGMCKTCAERDPAVAAANFHQRITELGGQVIGKYTNTNTPVECLCPEGHPCTPRPGDIQQGNGMCKTCAGRDPAVAAANFHQRITELGGIIIGKYTNANTPVECLCPEGHQCTPRPGNIQQGNGMCKTCKNKTETKLQQWLTQCFTSVTSQPKYAWCRNPTTDRHLPFDFELTVDGKSVIIELDGAQHFTQVSNWQGPDHTRFRDVYKMYQAINYGKAIIRLQQEDVYYDRIDWQTQLTKAITIIKTETVMYLGDQGIYADHQEDLIKMLRGELVFKGDSEATDEDETL